MGQIKTDLDGSGIHHRLGAFSMFLTLRTLRTTRFSRRLGGCISGRSRRTFTPAATTAARCAGLDGRDYQGAMRRLGFGRGRRCRGVRTI